MKSVIRILSVLAVVFMLFAPQYAKAQQKGDLKKGGSPEQILEKMTAELQLTEQQQTKIAKILEESKKKRQAIMEGAGEQEDKKTAIKEVMQQQKAAVKEVLTEEQLAKATQLKEERKTEVKTEKEHREKRKALKSAVEAYTAENIHPVMKEQRIKLDKALSAADKKAIAQIRANLAENKAALKAKKEEMHKVGKKREDLTEAEKAAFKQLMEARKTEMEKAKAIVKRYDSQIQSLFEEVKPQSDQWEKDLKEIHAQHKPVDGGMQEREGKPMPGKRPHHGEKGDAGQEHNGEKMKEMKATRFLLLDPSEENKAIKKSNDTKPSGLKVFPNPAQGFNNVQFKVEKAGEVVLELHDQDGNLVRTIVNENRAAGEYTERVNLGDLNGFVYVYVLKTPSGEVLSEKLVIRK
jgi:DNA repair exonuclease SbcCD ATPase subunit